MVITPTVELPGDGDELATQNQSHSMEQTSFPSSSNHYACGLPRLAMLKPPRKFYVDITLGLTILTQLLETTLHVVVAIFGIGVGVGLILGDSFRSTVPANLENSAQVLNHGSFSTSFGGRDNIDSPISGSTLSMSSVVILDGLPPQ
jgi:hypothetical protein